MIASILSDSIPNVSFFAVFINTSNIILKEEKSPKDLGIKTLR